MQDLIRGVPHATFTVQSGDTAKTFSELEGLAHIIGVVNELFVSVETASIRIACPETPTQAGLGILFGAGDMFRVGGSFAIQSLRFISAEAGKPATLQVMALVH